MNVKKLIRLSTFIISAITLTACGKKEADVKPAPIADFDFNPKTEIYEGTTVNFTNKSTNGKTYSWNFGDSLRTKTKAFLPSVKKTTFAQELEAPVKVVPSGATSMLENPIKQFLYAGTYTVTLTVTGDGGTATKTATIQIGYDTRER